MNPTTLGGELPVTPALTMTTTASLAFRAVSYYAGDGPNFSEVDERRIGGTDASVTPVIAPVVTPTSTPTATPTVGEPVEPTTNPTATPPIKRGDGNGDGVVDAGDISACVLEIFDGDGNFWLDAPGGTFAGTPGCDANVDTIIDAGDITCTVLLIFNGPTACAASPRADDSANRLLLVDAPRLPWLRPALTATNRPSMW